jgi:hypothetical protein
MNDLLLSKQQSIPTKGEIQKQALELVEQVHDGWVDPIKAYGALTALEQLIDIAKKQIKQIVIDKAEVEYGNKEFDYCGATFKIKNLPADTKSFFLENEKWQKANQKVVDAKAKLAGIEETLKKEIKLKGLSFPSTGTTIQVTLKK